MSHVKNAWDFYCTWKNEAQTKEMETFKKVSLFNSDPSELDKNIDTYVMVDGVSTY